MNCFRASNDRFSLLNYAMTHPDYYHMGVVDCMLAGTTMWNAGSAYLIPNYESTGICFPFLNSYSCPFPNPMAAANQALANISNMPGFNFGCGGCGGGENVDSYTSSNGATNSWMTDGFGATGAGGWSNYGIPDGNLYMGNMQGVPGMPGMTGSWFGMDGTGTGGGMFTPWWDQNGGGSGTVKTQAEKIANNEYNELRTSAQKIANIKGLDSNVKTILTNALNKNGTTEEKKQALKDAINTIQNKNEFFKESAIVDSFSSLAEIGFAFPQFKYFSTPDDTTKIMEFANNFVDEVKANIENDGGKAEQLISMCANDEEKSGYKYLIPTLSIWNNKNGNIIEYISKNGGNSISSDPTKNKAAAKAIDYMVSGLCGKANQLIVKDSHATNLKNAKEALVKAHAKINKDGHLSQAQVDAVATAFDKLYVQIRMYEAQLKRNEILQKYEILNNLEKGLIPDDIVVKETIEDLNKEGFKVSNSNYDRIKRPEKIDIAIVEEKSDLDDKPAKTQLNGLVSNGSITKVANNKELYESDTVKGKKYYAVTNKDGKDVLVEVSGITSIDAEGKINGEYATLNEAIEAKAVTVEGITPTVVQNRVQTKATIDKLKESGDIVLQKGGGYRSKNKGANGTEYYEINADGAFVKKGTNELVTNVPDENTFMDAQHEKLNRLIDEGKIKQSNRMVGGRKDIYYSTARDKYGHYQYFIMHPRLGLKRIPGIELYVGGTVDMVKNGIKHQKHINDIKDDEFWPVKEDEIPFKKESTQVNDKKPKTETKAQGNTGKTNEYYQKGADIYSWVNWVSDDYNYPRINEYLLEANKDNVMDILKGYYNSKGNYGGDGIIEQLDCEYDGGAITMEAKMNLINAFVEYVKSTSLYKTDNDTIQKIAEIENILKLYEEGNPCENCDAFNNNSILGWNSDNTKIDDRMKEIIKKLNNNNKSTKTSAVTFKQNRDIYYSTSGRSSII